MGTLSGTILNSVGDPLTNARVVLVPTDPTQLSGSEVRLGGVTVTLAADGTFLTGTVPNGTYRLKIRYTDPLTRAVATTTTAMFPISGATALDATLTVTRPALVAGTSTYTAPGISVPFGSLDRWWTARAKSATQLVEVAVYGDSTMYGETLAGEASYYSPVQRLRERLIAAGYTDGGHGNLNGLDDVTSAGESLVRGAGFSGSNVYVLPGESAYSDVSGDNQTFTRIGRYLTIWYSRFNSGGRFTYEIDSSGTEVPIDPAYPNAGGVHNFAHTAVIDLGTNGTHTIKFRNKGGRLVLAPNYTAGSMPGAGTGGTLATGNYEYAAAFVSTAGAVGPLGAIRTSTVTLGQTVTFVLLAQAVDSGPTTRFYRRVAGVGNFKQIGSVATDSGSPYVFTDTGFAAGIDYAAGSPPVLESTSKWVDVATIVTKGTGIVLHNLTARGSDSSMASDAFNAAIGLGLDLEAPKTGNPASGRVVDATSGARNPVLTILTHGINDQQHSPADNSVAYSANLVEAIRAARQAGSDVLVTLPCWETAVNQSNAGLYRAAAKAACAAEGAPWVDIGIGGALPSVVAGGTTNPHLTIAQYQAQGDFIWNQVLGLV